MNPVHIPGFYCINLIRTYKDEANAHKAVEKRIGSEIIQKHNLRYMLVYTKEGRVGVVFFGMKSIEVGIFNHFNCVG